MPNNSVARRKPEPAEIAEWVVRIMSGIISSVWNGMKHFAAQMAEPNREVLIEAVKSNNVELLRKLLRELPARAPSEREFKMQYLEHQDINSRWTALMFAAAQGNAECVFLLLSAGADTNHADGQGRTPLHLACKEGHAAAVQRLLDGRSNPFVEDLNAFTALDHALKLNPSNEQHTALVRAVERHGYFSGTVGMKVAKWPFRKAWESRWVLVTPRRANPRSRPNAPTRLLMTWFKAPGSFQVMGKVWLSDATVKMSEEAGALPELSLTLQRAHEKPSDAFCITDTNQRHTLQLRPANDTPIARQALVAVLNTIQTRPSVMPPPSQAAPPALAIPIPQRTSSSHVSISGQQQRPLRPYASVPTAAVPRLSASPTPSSARPPAVHSQHHSISDDEAMARALQEEFNRQAGAPATVVPFDGPLGQGAANAASPLAQGASKLGSPGGRNRTTSRIERSSLPASAPPQVPTPAAGEGGAALHAPTRGIMGKSGKMKYFKTKGASVSANTPPKPSSVTAPGAEAEEENVCLVCQEGEPTSGFLHGSSIHKCVCKSCANMYIDRKIPDCPMCREKIVQVVLNIY